MLGLHIVVGLSTPVMTTQAGHAEQGRAGDAAMQGGAPTCRSSVRSPRAMPAQASSYTRSTSALKAGSPKPGTCLRHLASVYMDFAPPMKRCQRSR